MTISKTVERMLEHIPEGTAGGDIRYELERWQDSAFLILPETEILTWHTVAAIMIEWVSTFTVTGPQELEDWQQQVLAIWNANVPKKDQPNR